MTLFQDRPISSSFLTFPPSEGTYTVDTDAFEKKLGFFLLQENTYMIARQIVYFKRSLNEAEREY